MANDGKEDYVSKFQDNGYAVIENFLTADEISSLKAELHKLIDDMDPTQHRSCFTGAPKEGNTQFQNNDDYFLTSGDKIRFFFEEAAMNEKGELAVDKHKSLNKIGHALHVLSTPFKKVTFSDKVKDVAKRLKFKQPKVCQSMVIFKNARIGGMVHPHQDCSYLYLDGDCRVCGFWFALEDATEENGGMAFIPGSHKSGLHNNRRFIRNPQPDGQLLILTNPLPDYNEEDFVPAPVKAGSLVLIDGYVVHQSSANLSDRSRNIYTFHMFESENATWSKDNWLQANGDDHELTFTPLYSQEVD